MSDIDTLREIAAVLHWEGYESIAHTLRAIAERQEATMDAETALRTEYGRGVTHGFETTLRLLLGESVDGAVPFKGPLAPECERWAREALAKIEAFGPKR